MRCSTETSMVLRMTSPVARADRTRSSVAACRGRRRRLVERLAWHVAPQRLEAIEVTRLGREDVDDDVEEVEQDPLSLTLSLDASGAHSPLAQTLRSTASAMARVWRVLPPLQITKKSV